MMPLPKSTVHSSPAASRVSQCQFCVDCSGLTSEIYNGDRPSMYMYGVVCYHVITTPYVRSVVNILHTVTHWYTGDDSEIQMSL